MDPFSQKNIKNLLDELNIKPQKKLGQNFLIDRGAMGRILEAADIRQGDIVLEIGAGIGNLTQGLAKKAKKVIAVEKDPEMCEILRKLLETMEIRNVAVVEGDIRNLDPEILNLKSGGYKVVANIPYYLTAFLIRNLLESKTPPKDMTLVVQKEVARRICPRPPKLKDRRRGKTPGMNLLAVSVQFYARPKIISYIKKSSFWPIPTVDSAIIKISQIRTNLPQIDTNLFFKIVRSGFSQPRKQLLNNLSNGLKMDREKVTFWLLQNNIQPTQRAETLSVGDWISLTKSCF